MEQSALLVMMRHGESEWNRRNLFTGWVDVPLSLKGVQQAMASGAAIRHLPLDIVFTSSLIRAQMTAMLALLDHSSGKVPLIQHEEGEQHARWGQIYGSEAEQKILPVFPAWELNERMYGELQGCNKAETAAQFGAEQVQIWRRSFDTAPPQGESLKMTAARTIPYFKKRILPLLYEGKNILIAAHGNSLRSIIMELDGLSQERVVKLEIPLGEPIFYRRSGDSLVKIEQV